MNVLSEQSEERVKRVSEGKLCLSERKLCLVVGSSVIDLFLNVEEKEYFEIKDNKVSFRLGDKIPLNIKTMTIGGNGANISVGLKRLGVRDQLFTYLGTDILSKQIEETVKSEGIDLIAEKDDTKNSSLSLIFDFNQDRIIFSHHQTRNHSFTYNSSGSPDYIFLTSIGVRWEKAFQEVLDYVEKKGIPLAFSPGIHQLDEGKEELLKTLAKTRIAFMNRSEAEKIVGEKKEVKELLKEIKKLGPSIVSLTDGENGAYALDENNLMFKISALSKNSVEKTGAGDAYASAFFTAYINKATTQDCMKWGSINAESVIQKVGAESGLLTSEEMEKKLSSNSEFRAEELIND